MEMKGKKDILILRITPHDKERIRLAADLGGQSLTTFALNACLKAADRVKQEAPSPTGRPRRRVGAFLLALCGDAAQGGENGYRGAGFKVATETHMLGARHYNTRGLFSERLAELGNHLKSRNRHAVLEWYLREYSVSLPMIPPRRRAAFVDGVFAAYLSGKMTFGPKRRVVRS